MTEEDRVKFVEHLLATADLYGKQLSKISIEMYWRDCRELSIQEFLVGLAKHRRSAENGQYMPKPADILRRVRDGVEQKGLLAWSELRDAVSRVGPYESVRFTDAVLQQVVMDMGGWVEMCNVTDRELPFIQKEFCRRYELYHETASERKRIEAKGGYLLGIHEKGNRKNGYQSQTPVIVGEKRKELGK